MDTSVRDIPRESYGVRDQNCCNSHYEEVREQVENLGYGIFDPNMDANEVLQISKEFDIMRGTYYEKYGKINLKNKGEDCTIRCPLLQNSKLFLGLALNAKLLQLIGSLISGSFVLNQQNGVINPPKKKYNQGLWHRDLPYQHFVSSRPLAVNALYCVDDFTFKNGSTFVIPGSHKVERYPSEQFIDRNALQVEAKAGTFIVLDCMLYHSGGFNRTDLERRAVNHVFNIPYFKQQINIPNNLSCSDLTGAEREILGFDYVEPRSVSDYLNSRNDVYRN